MKRALPLLLFCTASAFGAGPLAFGVKGGTALQDLVDAQGSAQSLFRKWTLGPMIDLDLPAGFGVEFDLLYRSTGYRIGATETTSGSWEFPLLVKYKFPGVVMRPYIDAGISFRHIGDLSLLGQPQQLFQFENGSRGLVIGAGFRLDLKLVKLSPELRYTYWGNQPLRVSNVVNYRQNQVEALFGLTF